MKIDYSSGSSNYGALYVDDSTTIHTKVKNIKFDRIEIIKYNRYWRMHLAHEIGHILHYHYISKPKPYNAFDRTDNQWFRQEVMAWRIAKAMTRTTCAFCTMVPRKDASCWQRSSTSRNRSRPFLDIASRWAMSATSASATFIGTTTV